MSITKKKKMMMIMTTGSIRVVYEVDCDVFYIFPLPRSDQLVWFIFCTSRYAGVQHGLDQSSKRWTTVY